MIIILHEWMDPGDADIEHAKSVFSVLPDGWTMLDSHYMPVGHLWFSTQAIHLPDSLGVNNTEIRGILFHHRFTVACQHSDLAGVGGGPLAMHLFPDDQETFRRGEVPAIYVPVVQP